MTSDLLRGIKKAPTVFVLQRKWMHVRRRNQMKIIRLLYADFPYSPAIYGCQVETYGPYFHRYIRCLYEVEYE